MKHNDVHYILLIITYTLYTYDIVIDRDFTLHHTIGMPNINDFTVIEEYHRKKMYKT